MAVPTAPTIAELVTEGIKRGGIPNPDSTQITSATTHQLREVKADIMLVASRHPLLRTTYVSPAPVNQVRITQPGDTDVVESADLYFTTGATSETGTATAGSSTSVTLAADYAGTADFVQGKLILITAGTGVGGFAQCLSYNSTTKVATVDSWAGGTAPGSGSTYVVGAVTVPVYGYNQRPTVVGPIRKAYHAAGVPQGASLIGESLWLDQPLYTYGAVLWTYWCDLDNIDDAGTVFLRFIREYRSLVVQGVAVKTMQRYDDARYTTELKVYQFMLEQLGLKVKEMNQSYKSRDEQLVDAMLIKGGQGIPQVNQG